MSKENFNDYVKQCVIIIFSYVLLFVNAAFWSYCYITIEKYCVALFLTSILAGVFLVLTSMAVISGCLMIWLLSNVYESYFELWGSEFVRKSTYAMSALTLIGGMISFTIIFKV